MRLRLIIALLLVVLASLFLARRCTRPSQTVEAPPMPEPRLLDVRDVTRYAEGRAGTLRVRSTRDVLPGGLSAAMAPLMIDWKHSDVRTGGGIVVGNLNHGGNPLSGVTVLRAARLYPEQLTEVQFITVPLGGHKEVVHGQLRFLFAPGGIELLGDNPEAVGEPDQIQDLVLSWEAWRAPGVDYDIMRGMDPTVYELSMRGYSGQQRFLEDTLSQRPWTAFTLKVPGGQAGLAEILRVNLAMGDGVARQVIGRMLTEAEETWRAAVTDPTQEDLDLAEAWLRLQAGMEQELARLKDSRIRLEGEQTGYQSLMRSCATMALYSVDVAVARMLEQGAPADGMRPTRTPELESDPQWLVDLSTAGWGQVLLNAPRALGFVRARPWVIPGKIPGLLDKAGLLVHEDGQPVKRFYSLATTTPWGHRNQLLIR
jgi:hypothetical protein